MHGGDGEEQLPFRKYRRASTAYTPAALALSLRHLSIALPPCLSHTPYLCCLALPPRHWVASISLTLTLLLIQPTGISSHFLIGSASDLISRLFFVPKVHSVSPQAYHSKPCRCLSSTTTKRPMAMSSVPCPMSSAGNAFSRQKFKKILGYRSVKYIKEDSNTDPVFHRHLHPGTS